MILREIDGGAKNVIGGTANFGAVGDAVQPHEGLVQRIVSEIGRPQTPGKVAL
jgi:hypothetical protein